MRGQFRIDPNFQRADQTNTSTAILPLSRGIQFLATPFLLPAPPSRRRTPKRARSFSKTVCPPKFQAHACALHPVEQSAKRREWKLLHGQNSRMQLAHEVQLARKAE